MDDLKNNAGTKPTQSARLDFVDAAKGVGILAVIFGHMDYLWSTPSVFSSSFKLAIFYLVVGFLKAHHYDNGKQAETCKTVWKKRLYSLVIPYAVYSVLAVLVHMTFAVIQHGSVADAFRQNLFLTVTLRGIDTLWFLPTMLLAELLFVAIRPEHRSKASKILLCALLPILLCTVCYFYERTEMPQNTLAQIGQNLFLVLAKSVSGCWFMLCGYYMYRHFDPKRLSGPVIPVLMLAVNFGLSLLSPNLDFNSFRLGGFGLVFYINGVLGSVAILELLRYLSGRVTLRPLIWCGKNSMFLMATHLPWYIAPLLIAVGKRFYTAQTPDVKYFAVMIAELAVLMAVEFVMIWFKDKAKGAISDGGKTKSLSRAIKYL